MIVEVGPEPARPSGLSRAALPVVVVAALSVALLPADTSPSQSLGQLVDRVGLERLVLPPDVIGVRIAAMPDRLLNDQPLSSLIWAVRVRGGEGIASYENGTTTVMWTERGTAYFMTSTRYHIAELVSIADRMR